MGFFSDLGSLINEASSLRDELTGIRDDAVSSVKSIAVGATDLTEETTQKIKDSAAQLSDAVGDAKKNITKE